MKYLNTAGILFVFVLLASCEKKVAPPLSPEQIRQKIDSIVAEKVQVVEERAAKDLEHRIKIEVKVKADSILNEMSNASRKDSGSH